MSFLYYHIQLSLFGIFFRPFRQTVRLFRLVGPSPWCLDPWSGRTFWLCQKSPDKFPCYTRAPFWLFRHRYHWTSDHYQKLLHLYESHWSKMAFDSWKFYFQCRNVDFDSQTPLRSVYGIPITLESRTFLSGIWREIVSVLVRKQPWIHHLSWTLLFITTVSLKTSSLRNNNF